MSQQYEELPLNTLESGRSTGRDGTPMQALKEATGRSRQGGEAKVDVHNAAPISEGARARPKRSGRDVKVHPITNSVELEDEMQFPEDNEYILNIKKKNKKKSNVERDIHALELGSHEGLEGGASRGDGKNQSDSDQSYTKRHKINTSRQDSQAESEADSEQKTGQMPKMRLLDRSQLMDMMLFP